MSKPYEKPALRLFKVSAEEKFTTKGCKPHAIGSSGTTPDCHTSQNTVFENCTTPGHSGNLNSY